jgi:hypothetical protein
MLTAMRSCPLAAFRIIRPGEGREPKLGVVTVCRRLAVGAGRLGICVGYDLGRRGPRHRQPQGHHRVAIEPDPRLRVLLDDRPLGQLGRDRLDGGDEAAPAEERYRVCSSERRDLGHRALSSPGCGGRRHGRQRGRPVRCEGIK